MAITISDDDFDLLASACEIARREGKDTNWPAFFERCKAVLASKNRRPVTARTFRAVDDGANA